MVLGLHRNERGYVLLCSQSGLQFVTFHCTANGRGEITVIAQLIKVLYLPTVSEFVSRVCAFDVWQYFNRN